MHDSNVLKTNQTKQTHGKPECHSSATKPRENPDKGDRTVTLISLSVCLGFNTSLKK